MFLFFSFHCLYLFLYLLDLGCFHHPVGDFEAPDEGVHGFDAGSFVYGVVYGVVQLLPEVFEAGYVGCSFLLWVDACPSGGDL